ncbi:alpha/beta hydrolase family protein [Nocardia sp. NPDC004068]|uniref:alpha/beta hydrolase family protein n=1 Tax=Nocardia sp. NPDC004068 TaxID=3364303 RepID=UPI00369E8A7D
MIARRVAAVSVLAALAIGGGHIEPAFADGALLCGADALACRLPATRATPLADPVGPHAVGRVDVEVGDESRALMVSVWYPAAGASEADDTPAAYVPATTSDVQLRVVTRAADWLHTPTAVAAMLGARSAAIEAAAVDSGANRLPVVLISPGLGAPRWIMSGLAADLASRGYAAIVMDHTGESPAVAFPDGRVVTGTAPDIDNDDYMAAELDTRVADARLVLDRLATLPVVGDHLDLGRVAMAGHSYGGYTTIATMVADNRIRAGVVLDGSAGWHDGSTVEQAGVDRPVEVVAYGDMVHASWIGFRARTTGPFRLATVRGGGHYSPTDLCAFGGQSDLCGTLPAPRAAQITCALVAEFLAGALLGQSVPSGQWPEVAWRTG